MRSNRAAIGVIVNFRKFNQIIIEVYIIISYYANCILCMFLGHVCSPIVSLL